jgi:integrase
VLSYSPKLRKLQKQDLKRFLEIEKKRAIIRPEIDPETQQKIEKLVLYLKRKGRGESTQTAYQKNLLYLAQRVLDLNDTEAVEFAIADYVKIDGHPATNNYKGKLCDCYARYCKFYNIPWEKPIYTPEPHSVQPPSTEKCEILISSAKMPLSIKIDISMETGLRPIEVVGEKGLHANDIHPDQKTITARSTKGCNPRPPIKISEELSARLKTYILENQLANENILFEQDSRAYGECFRIFKKALAKKLNDPSIATIRLYDLRHYYVTKQLRKTQNAEIVRQIVGHKRLDTTQKYMHLLAGNSGEWIVEGAADKERAKELLANDFTYQLTTPDGTMLFRKPQ